MTALNLVLPATQARVNVTFEGKNGELPDPVLYDSTDGDMKGWITEALRTGGIPGIEAFPNANIADYVVDRFAASDERPYNFVMIRPKTPFGAGPKSTEAAKETAAILTETIEKLASDVVVHGDPGATWELVCSAHSQNQGWRKVTKRMKVQGGYLFQVSTEHRDASGSVSACAEALTFVPMQSVGMLTS